MFTSIAILMAFVVGAIAAYAIFKFLNSGFGSNTTTIKNESSVLLEKVEKVFKVVLAEGSFSEIYDHTSQKDILFGLGSTNKKALIVAKAKVLVGFDFAKAKMTFVPDTRKMIVEEFPKPEVLSIDSDYKFYDIDNGWFNKFKNEDYTQLLSDAKQTMQHKAIASELPRIAKKQAVLMLSQMAQSMNWELEFKQLPPAEEIKLISEKIEFTEIRNQ
jgi:hypothetical protein